MGAAADGKKFPKSRHHSPMDRRAITLERVEKFLSPLYWTDCNLYGAQWEERSASGIEVR